MMAGLSHLSCLHALLTYPFNVLKFVIITLPSLMVKCVRLISLLESGGFFLHVRISVWIDLGGTAPPTNVCLDLAAEPLTQHISLYIKKHMCVLYINRFFSIMIIIIAYYQCNIK